MKGQSGDSGTKHPKYGMIQPPLGLGQLSVFVEVAAQASFVQASRRLRIPTSTVSRAVARLEEAVGVQLLRRTSRKVVLTEEGRNLYLLCAPHLEGITEALLGASDRKAEVSGVVRVTAPAYTGSTLVADALAAFALAHPKIDVELDASNTLRDLVHEGYDFGVRVSPVQHADFVTRRLLRGQFGLFATRELVTRALRGRTTISQELLEKSPCIALRPTPEWRFTNAHGELTRVTPRVRFAVNDPRAALEVARRGLGIVLSPLDLVGARATGLVRLRPDFGEPEPLDLYVLYPTRRLLPRRVRLAIDWLIKSCAGV